MIESFVRRPAMTVVFVLVFVVLGIFSYTNLIIESTPRVELPLVSINAPYPGAGPVEIESEILKPIEDAVAEISEIKTIQSYAYESFGFVMIEFDIKSDINLKSVEVKDKVEQILNDLPEESERPIIARFDPLVVPIQELVLTSDSMDPREMYEYADIVLTPALSTVPGVASVDLSGGRQRQINVNLDPNLMKQHFVTASDVVRVIHERNLNVPGGTFTRGPEEITVRFLGEFQSVDDIRKMPIITAEGITIQLADIASVEDAYRKVSTVSRYNGRDAVGLSVNKLSDGDAVSISAQVKRKVQEINEGLPEGTSLVMAYDSTEFILTDTQATLVNILIGIILTVLILYMFLGNFRVTLVAAVVIPTSIVSTFLLMDFSDFTINMMSLLAIGTALGTLIANAIVIIEGIVAEIEKGSDPATAAVVGTKKVTVAVLASAGTNVVVFTPIAFMGGIVGQFMQQFGLTVVYATLFSILASFTLTPMLCSLILKPQNQAEKKGKRRNIFYRLLYVPVSKVMDYALKEYRHVFDFLFRYPKTSVAICIAFAISPIFVMPYIGSEFISQSDQDVLRISLELPQGAALEETVHATKKVEEVVKDYPEVVSYLSRAGINGLENATVIVRLKPGEERDRTDLDLITDMTPAIAKIPGAKITLARGESGGPPGLGDVTVDVYGYDYDTMVQIASDFEEIMKESGYFRATVSSHKDPRDEVVFVPNDAAMRRFGVINAELGGLIRTAITGDDTAIYKEQGEEYKINVTLADRFKSSTEDLSSLFVQSNSGLLPLANLGELSTQKALPPLQRRDKQRIIQVGGYLSKSTAGAVQGELNALYAAYDMPEGYSYKFSGMAESMEETGTEIAKAFLMAVILTYMLLVAMLNSFIHPFTIVTAVFTSFVGVFYTLFFLEFSINIGSMMAFVMLVGLAVNNAILLLDKTMVEHKEKGLGIIDALWVGTQDRFRPIAMTSVSVIAGTFPQIFDTNGVKASMGAVIIGGMLASMFFTFVLIPLAYWYVERLVAWTGRRFGRDAHRQAQAAGLNNGSPEVSGTF